MRKAGFIVIAALSFLAANSQSPKSREHYLSEVSYFTLKIAEEPDNISNYYLRATFNHILTNFSNSTQDFKKVLELYYRNPSRKYAQVATDACYFLADDYYFRKADRLAAQAYIEHGLKISPGDKRFEVLQTGILGTYPEKAAEAARKFEVLISKYPDDQKIALYYAKFLEGKEPNKAIGFYERVISINPYNIDALFALGTYYTNEASRIFKENGDPRKVLDYTQKGTAYFERVHQLNPDDKEIVEILIQCYGNLNRDFDVKKMERKLNGR